MPGEKQPQNSQRDPAAHLRQFRWKPGESGNPRGRPRGSSRVRRIRAILDRDPAAIANVLTRDDLEQLIRLLVDHAIAGDIQCTRMILDTVCPVGSSRRRRPRRRELCGPEPSALSRFRKLAAALGVADP